MTAGPPRPRLVARISGGLGNQMFIYAAARRLALKNDADLLIDAVNGFSRDSYGRFYQLDCFKLGSRPAKPTERMQPCNRLRRSYMKARFAKRPFSNNKYIKQRGIDFDPTLLEARLGDWTYFEGLWQGDGYFADIADTVRDDFTFIQPIDAANRAAADKIASAEQAVALHVRFFAPPGTQKSDNAALDYYRRALAALEHEIETPHYFVFSDRPQDAAAMLALPNDRHTLICHNNTDALAPYDMWLMRQCRHFIIANSTFSWWGAWLGTAEDKRVFAPALTQDKAGKYAGWGIEGLLPASWQQIEA